MKVNLNNLSCSCLFHLIKNTYKYIFKWDEYSKYSNDERLKKEGVGIATSKKRTSTKRKGNKKTNKKSKMKRL